MRSPGGLSPVQCSYANATHFSETLPTPSGLSNLAGDNTFASFLADEEPPPEVSPAQDGAAYFSPDSAFFNFDAFSPLAPVPGELDMDAFLGAFLGVPTHGATPFDGLPGLFDVGPDDLAPHDSAHSVFLEEREKSDHWSYVAMEHRCWSSTSSDKTLRRVARAWPTFYEAPPITVLPQLTGSATEGTHIDDSTLKILQAGLSVC